MMICPDMAPSALEIGLGVARSAKQLDIGRQFMADPVIIPVMQLQSPSIAAPFTFAATHSGHARFQVAPFPAT
jgi:hypothetical protein